MEQLSHITRSVKVLEELKAYVLSSKEKMERQLETSKKKRETLVKKVTI